MIWMLCRSLRHCGPHGSSGGAGERSSAPADAFLAADADAGAFAALGGQDVGVACVGVAPAQVGVQFAGQGGVVRMVRAGDHEGA